MGVGTPSRRKERSVRNWEGPSREGSAEAWRGGARAERPPLVPTVASHYHSANHGKFAPRSLTTRERRVLSYSMRYCEDCIILKEAAERLRKATRGPGRCDRDRVERRKRRLPFVRLSSKRRLLSVIGKELIPPAGDIGRQLVLC
ncbi:unnamed protein product, partial [Iphiclides podalirius]